MRRRFELLERAAVLEPVPRRQCHICSHLLARGGDERPEIAIAHIRSDDHATLAVLATDLIRTDRDFDARQLSERHELGQCRFAKLVRIARHLARCDGQLDRQHRQHGRIRAQRIIEAHEDAEAPISLEQDAGMMTAECGAHDALNFGHRQPVTRQPLAIRIDGEQRQSRHLFHLDVRCAIDAGQHRLDPAADGSELFEIITVDFHCHVRPNAGNELVEAHLDRLREFIVAAGNLGGGDFQLVNQCGFGLLRIRPVAARLHDDEGVRDRRRHGIVGYLGGTQLAEDMRHLGHLAQPFFEHFLHLDGLSETGARDA